MFENMLQKALRRVKSGHLVQTTLSTNCAKSSCQQAHGNPRAYVRQACFSNILYTPNVANL